MLNKTIAELTEAITEAHLGTTDPTQKARLDFAQMLVRRGQEFLDIGDQPTAWLWLNGAAGLLQIAGVPISWNTPKRPEGSRIAAAEQLALEHA